MSSEHGEGSILATIDYLYAPDFELSYFAFVLECDGVYSSVVNISATVQANPDMEDFCAYIQIITPPSGKCILPTTL